MENICRYAMYFSKDAKYMRKNMLKNLYYKEKYRNHKTSYEIFFRSKEKKI